MRRTYAGGLPPAVAESHGSARGLGKLRSYMQLTRSNSAAMAALPTGIGALAAGFDTPRIVGAGVLGMAVHCFANIVNALADVEQDRTDPRRRNEALVSGAITPRQAVLSALILLLLIGPATLVLLDSTTAAFAYLAIVGLYAYANVFQKRSAHVGPVAMDLAFGVVVAGPIAVVASASGQLPDAALLLLTCSMVFQIAASNVLVGTTKDLECDLRYGVRTSAIELGVRPGDDGPVVTRRFASYAIALQVMALLSGLVAGLVATPAGLLSVSLTVFGGTLLIAGTFNVLSLVTPLRGAVTASSRPWSLQTNYFATVALAAAQLRPASVGLLLAGVIAVTGLSIALAGGRRASLDRLLRLQDATVEPVESLVGASDGDDADAMTAAPSHDLDAPRGGRRR